MRLAAAFFELEPQADAQDLGEFLARRMGSDKEVGDKALQGLYAKYGPDRWSLADRGYLAGVHPLELWVVGYLRHHPEASLSEVLAQSREQRQDVYAWLFRTSHKGAQDLRIRNLIEQEAFAEILQRWRRLGYPFETLTPSYATALGASGDRPAALAELMGIIVNHGVRLPVVRVPSLQFGAGTPYETHLQVQPSEGERLLPAEVADTVREALAGVVEGGTASRLKGAFVRDDGTPAQVGGKTGTGDHRFDVFGKGGRLVSSRVVSRTGTLVFYIGDRYFGTMMAYVREPVRGALQVHERDARAAAQGHGAGLAAAAQRAAQLRRPAGSAPVRPQVALNRETTGRSGPARAGHQPQRDDRATLHPPRNADEGTGASSGESPQSGASDSYRLAVAYCSGLVASRSASSSCFVASPSLARCNMLTRSRKALT